MPDPRVQLPASPLLFAPASLLFAPAHPSGPVSLSTTTIRSPRRVFAHPSCFCSPPHPRPSTQPPNHSNTQTRTHAMTQGSTGVTSTKATAAVSSTTARPSHGSRTWSSSPSTTASARSGSSTRAPTRRRNSPETSASATSSWRFAGFRKTPRRSGAILPGSRSLASRRGAAGESLVFFGFSELPALHTECSMYERLTLFTHCDTWPAPTPDSCHPTPDTFSHLVTSSHTLLTFTYSHPPHPPHPSHPFFRLQRRLAPQHAVLQRSLRTGDPRIKPGRVRVLSNTTE